MLVSDPLQMVRDTFKNGDKGAILDSVPLDLNLHAINACLLKNLESFKNKNGREGGSIGILVSCNG